MKTKLSIIVTATLLTALSTFAESRIWTDAKGNTIEAEFVLLTGDKALLKQVDGNELKVSLHTLSEDDRIFILKKSPPRLELDVNLDIKRSNDTHNFRPGFQIQTESMTAKVVVRKTGTTPYDAPLFSEIFLIG